MPDVRTGNCYSAAIAQQHNLPLTFQTFANISSSSINKTQRISLTPELLVSSSGAVTLQSVFSVCGRETGNKYGDDTVTGGEHGPKTNKRRKNTHKH